MVRIIPELAKRISVDRSARVSVDLSSQRESPESKGVAALHSQTGE
jgi:hypothetical protein